MTKQQLKDLIKETLSETNEGDVDKNFKVGNTLVSFVISASPPNRIRIEFYNNDANKNQKTNKKNLFYSTEANSVASFLRQKLGVEKVEFINQNEYYLGTPEIQTGKKIYRLVVDSPDSNILLTKLLIDACKN